MTISTTIVKNSYSGNGATTVFNYNFKILSSSDLKVIIRSSTGTETTKTLNTHYTLTGVGSAGGGSITFTAGNIPTSGQTIVLIRDTTQTQSIDYVANDPFPAETHEEGLDKGIILAQELQEEVDRCIKLSRTNAMTSTEFTVGAADRANKILAFDANGEIAVTQELGTYRGNWSTATSYAGRDLVKDTSNNNIYYVNTAHTSSGSQPLSSNANSSYYTLIVDAASAASSATASATSAAAALASQNAASSSASAASSSASAASSSASAASSSASAASSSAASAATSYDDFDDRYLGSKSSAPTLDNDGNALINGALYWNSVSAQMFVRDSGAWVVIKPTTVEQGNITTVAGISANVTTVAGISANVTSVAGNSTNINSVAGNSANINTVATNNANINTVAGANANITTVAGISADITTVATNAGNISTVATDIAKVITAANDLNEATSEIEVVANAIANVDTVGSAIANVNTVATNIANINSVNSNSTNINAVNSNSANINTVATNNANITTVATNIANVNSVNSNSTNINSVAGNSTNINSVASNSANINSVAGSIANVNTVATNIGSVNDFSARYRVSATAPTTSLDLGDLYFDTTSNTMKVYSSGGFINAGSSVNGTADRYKYTATASQTTFTGADDNSNTLAYDAGFLDVYLNGIKLVNGSDFTASSGTSIVLTVGASASDILEVIAYGTFQLANFSIADANDVPPLGTAGQVLKVNSGATALEYGTIDLTNLNATNLTSGTLPDARFPATLPATSGANLTSLNASNLSSGTVSTARLGSGTANATNFLRGDNSWQTISTSPSQLVSSIPLASGGAVTAGRGTFINSSGEVAIYPTVNTLGTVYQNSATNDGYISVSNNGARAIKITGTASVITITGVTNNGTANAVDGSVTVSNTNSNFATGGGSAVPAGDDKFMVFHFKGNNTFAPPGGFNIQCFIVTVDASGNCTKGNVVTLTGSVGGSGPYPAGMSTVKITDNIFGVIGGVSDTGGSSSIATRTLTVSGDTTTATSDTYADVNFFVGAGLFDTVFTSNNIIGWGTGTNWLTAPYTTGNIGTGTTTTIITDHNTTPVWYRITNSRVIVYYRDTNLLYKLRTYDVNQTTGALTLVDTEFLTGLAFASSVANFRFKDQTSGVFSYLVSGFYYANSISLDSSGNILGFNLGSNFGSVAPSYINYNSSNDFFFQYYATNMKIVKYTVNAYTTTTPNYLGIAKTTDSTSPVDIVTDGVASGFTGLTAGNLYYLSTAYDGTVSTDVSSGIFIGKAISATEILMQRSNTQ